MSLKYLNLTGLSNLVSDIKNWVTARIPTKTSEITNDSGYLTAHQAVSNSAPTLAWGTTSTIGKVGSTNLTVTMPANPNTDTDTKVTQTVTTGSTLYPVIVGNTASATATETSGVRFSSKLLMNTRYGYLRGLSYDSDNLKGVAPSAARTCGGSIQFYTYDDTESGRLWNEVLADGSRQTYIEVTNYITNGALATDGKAIHAHLRLRVYATGAKKIYCNGGWENNLIPDATNTRTLGTSSLAWKSVYANAYYLGSTAFGDIVTHNASEFLTSHQSLSNYSTKANTVKSLSISGKTITVTPGSGDAYTLTTQDTVYTHPTTAGNKHIPSGGSSGQILKYSSSGTAVWADVGYIHTMNQIASRTTVSNGTWSISCTAYQLMMVAISAIGTNTTVQHLVTVTLTSGASSIVPESTTAIFSLSSIDVSATAAKHVLLWTTAATVKITIANVTNLSSLTLYARQ